jgi:hypothetical protein
MYCIRNKKHDIHTFSFDKRVISSQGSLYLGNTFEPVSISFESSSPVSSIAQGSQLVVHQNSIVGLATPSAVYTASCTFQSKANSCMFKLLLEQDIGIVHGSAANAQSMWLCSNTGLYFFQSLSSPDTKVILSGHSIQTVALDTDSTVVMAGNSEKIWTISPGDGSVLRWEWVTDQSTGTFSPHF